jgi:hypothetical protein
MCFFHPLHLNFADGVRHPLGCFRLRGFQEDFRCRLREHHLGDMSIDVLQLGLPLKAENERILAFSVLGNGGVKLTESLQACEFVEHKPHRCLVLLGCTEEPQDEPVDPEAVKRLESVPLRRTGGDENPAPASFCPFCRAPTVPLGILQGWKHTQAVSH